jgi:hypothetical protein
MKQKKTIFATVYSIIAFCVISYFSVITSLLSTMGNPSNRPVANIGFPLKYYYQFWVAGNPGPNCGWRPGYFILDFLLIWTLTTTIYLLIKRKK